MLPALTCISVRSKGNAAVTEKLGRGGTGTEKPWPIPWRTISLPHSAWKQHFLTRSPRPQAGMGTQYGRRGEARVRNGNMSVEERGWNQSQNPMDGKRKTDEVACESHRVATHFEGRAETLPDQATRSY